MLSLLGLFTGNMPSGTRILRFYVTGYTPALDWSPEVNTKMRMGRGGDPRKTQEEHRAVRKGKEERS